MGLTLQVGTRQAARATVSYELIPPKADGKEFNRLRGLDGRDTLRKGMQPVPGQVTSLVPPKSYSNELV